MKINITSTNHRSKSNKYFNFKLSDLEYIKDKEWDNKIFNCWYKNKYIYIILWKKSSFNNILDEGHGRSVDRDVIFDKGEFITFTYDDNDYSEWESKINKKFMKYKNIHTNEICVLLGSGPSLKKYKKIKNAIHFGVNHMNKQIDFDIDYYFLNDWGGVIKDPSVLNYKVNKMRFFSYYKKKSNSLKYGEGIYPKYKNTIIKSKLPFEFIECVPRRDARIKDFKWFRELEKYGLGSSINSMIRILQIALFMGFKHIILVGCDCSGKYNAVLPLWKQSFSEVDRLYNDVNIFVYNSINLHYKPEFNLLNIMILKKEENKYFFNKHLMDILFKKNNWENFKFNNLIFKNYDKSYGYIESENPINNNIISLTENSIIRYIFNKNLFNVSKIIVNDKLKSMFNNIVVSYNKDKYNDNYKYILINNTNIINKNIINVIINFKENIIIINNDNNKEYVILGKIIYFLKYYNINITSNNIVDILILSIRYNCYFNILSNRKLCFQEFIDKYYFKDCLIK